MSRLSLFPAAILAAIGLSQAATLPYQGILTDASGNPVKDGSYSVSLSLYGQSAGGTALWTEPQSATTKKGLFSLSLGSVSSIPDALFARDSLFLGISVASGAELTPRTRFGASPWAVRARTADTATFARSSVQVGNLFDSAALTARLGKKVDTSALTTRLADYATFAALKATRDTLKTARDSIASLTARVADYATFAALKATRDTLKTARDSIASLTAKWTNLDYRLVMVGTQELTDHQADSLKIVALQAAHLADSINIATLQGNITAILAILKGVKRVGNELYFDSVNVNIRNGLGSTATINHLGNLVVGYNESTIGTTRTGSHSVVVGSQHSWTTYGHIIGGQNNTVTGEFASATAGWGGNASGPYSSISGGENNTASGQSASVTGGSMGRATGSASFIGGGANNAASGENASVTGGQLNVASAMAASVSGGYVDTASGTYASTSGGRNNNATGEAAAVTGGLQNRAIGVNALVVGGRHHLASGDSSVVSGGSSDTASGAGAYVSGGSNNNASGLNATIFGGQSNSAASPYSSILGGQTNSIYPTRGVGGAYSTITGGNGLISTADNQWVHP